MPWEAVPGAVIQPSRAPRRHTRREERDPLVSARSKQRLFNIAKHCLASSALKLNQQQQTSAFRKLQATSNLLKFSWLQFKQTSWHDSLRILYAQYCNCVLLGCDAVWSGKSLLTIRRTYCKQRAADFACFTLLPPKN